MNEDFVNFDLAKKLKEKGFYYKCASTYDNDAMLGYNYIQPTSIRAIGFNDCLCSHNVENDGCIDAPTISQVLKWLREEKKINVLTTPMLKHSDGKFYWGSEIYDISGIPDMVRYKKSIFNQEDYNEAALASIEYCLDNLIYI